MEQNITANEQVLLKTRFFGGFEKKQVLEYIDTLREQNRRSVDELDQKIAQMSAARGELEEQVGGFSQKIAELEQQLEQRGGKIHELTGIIDSLQSDLEANRKAKSESDHILAQQKEQNRQLAIRAQSFEQKARRYDDVSLQLGEIVLEAQKNAQEVVSAAEQKAEDIRKDAVCATERAAEEMRSLRTDISAIRQNIEEMMQGLHRRLDAIDEAIDQMERRSEKKTAEQEALTPEESSSPAEQAPEVPHFETECFFRPAAEV